MQARACMSPTAKTTARSMQCPIALNPTTCQSTHVGFFMPLTVPFTVLPPETVPLTVLPFVPAAVATTLRRERGA